MSVFWRSWRPRGGCQLCSITQKCHFLCCRTSKSLRPSGRGLFFLKHGSKLNYFTLNQWLNFTVVKNFQSLSRNLTQHNFAVATIGTSSVFNNNSHMLYTLFSKSLHFFDGNNLQVGQFLLRWPMTDLAVNNWLLLVKGRHWIVSTFSSEGFSLHVGFAAWGDLLNLRDKPLQICSFSNWISYTGNTRLTEPKNFTRSQWKKMVWPSHYIAFTHQVVLDST